MLTTGDALCNGIGVYKDGKLVADIFEDPQSGVVHVYAYRDFSETVKVINHDFTN